MIESIESSKLRTLPEIARALHVTIRRAEHAAIKGSVEPVGKIGVARVFDDRGVAQIRATIKDIERRREVADA